MKFTDFNMNHFNDVRNITKLNDFQQFDTNMNSNQILLHFPGGINAQIGYFDKNSAIIIMENVYSIAVDSSMIQLFSKDPEHLDGIRQYVMRRNYMVIVRGDPNREIILVLEPLDRFLIQNYQADIMYPDIISHPYYDQFKNIEFIEIYARFNPYDQLILIDSCKIDDPYEYQYVSFAKMNNYYCYINKFNPSHNPICIGDYVCFEMGCHIYAIESIDYERGKVNLKPVFRPLSNKSKKKLQMSICEIITNSVFFSKESIFIINNMCIYNHTLISFDQLENSPVNVFNDIMDLLDQIEINSLGADADFIKKSSEMFNKIDIFIKETLSLSNSGDIIVLYNDTKLINLTTLAHGFKESNDMLKAYNEYLNGFNFGDS